MHPQQEAPEAEKLVTVIRPNAGWAALGLGELWAYRDLLYQMATRDFRARYKQSVLGKIWAVAQPLTTLLIYYVIFGLVLGIKSDAVPFPLFLLAGILMWQLFSTSANSISVSLTSNAHLVNKIYFPRLLIPLASSLASLVDFAFAFAVLLVSMLCYGHFPGWLAPLCLVFIVLALVAGLAVGLWFAPLNVAYRDMQQLVPLVLTVLMYLSPVFYPPTKISARFQLLYFLNPMAGIIQGFRWTLLGDQRPPLAALGGMAAMVAAFIGGLYYFRRNEADLADRI
jgi:lipopolysaccharide transport system permease protein